MSATTNLSVELPAGGVLHLQTAEEVDLWERSLERYRQDYVMVKQNDLFNLGALLQAQISLFRAQTAINGMEPELDSKKVPTGRYKRVELDAGDYVAYQKVMSEASREMRALEKTLGIDKATREAGGAHTVDNYLTELKKAAHERGVHISKRLLEYERVINDLRVRLRMLYGADVEDRAYHNISPKTILDWAKAECDALELVDQKFGQEVGKVFVGRL